MAKHQSTSSVGILNVALQKECGNPDARYNHLVEFLREKGAEGVNHTRTSFLNHLIEVKELLQKWGEPDETIIAGLFHSIYGTENFRRALLKQSDRGHLRALIGDRAEWLAHLYCGMQSRSFFQIFPRGAPYEIQTRWQSRPISLNEEDMRAIAAIFIANWLEQFPRMRAKSRAQHIAKFRQLADWIGGAAGSAIDEAYGFGRPPLVIERALVHPEAPDLERIEIWDDAVPSELQLSLSGLVDLNIWRYGWKASSEQTSYGFWHSHFGGDDDHKSSNCEHDLIGRPIVKPVLDLWRMLEAGPLKEHIPVRVYANGHTFGGDGHVHRDHSEEGHFTTIYYAHPVWEPNWAGETVFFNQAQNDIIRAVYPKPGRLVHFPGHIMHAARSPGRECSALRAVIVIKTRLKQSSV